jgi:enoyl-CoA hydratase
MDVRLAGGHWETLDAESGLTPISRSAASSIREKSPLSLKIALAQLQRGKRLDFQECMRMEYRIVSRIVQGHDFYEGIRALTVDKDRRPRWRPTSLEETSDAGVEAHFASLPAELTLP